MGDYFEGQQHGYGKLIWADGSEYIGGFNYGTIEGEGRYNWSDGRNF